MISRFFTNTYTVTRPAPGYYREGIYTVSGPPEVIQVQGSLQPLNARELKLVSEGGRLKQYYKFYTDCAILTIGTKKVSGADVIQINGESYKVMSVEHWEGVGIPYYKSLVYREPEQ